MIPSVAITTDFETSRRFDCKTPSFGMTQRENLSAGLQAHQPRNYWGLDQLSSCRDDLLSSEAESTLRDESVSRDESIPSSLYPPHFLSSRGE